jgi:hypothetical protein
MQFINGKILLSELADELGVTHTALLQQLGADHPGGLGVGAKKFDGTATSNWMLTIDSTINYLNWAKTKSRKIDKGKISELENKLSRL